MSYSSHDRLLVVCCARVPARDIHDSHHLLPREERSHVLAHLAFIARYAGDALFLIVEMFIMALMIYFMTNLSERNHSANFGYFFWVLLLTRWLSIGITHTCASIFASPGFAATILIAYMNTLFAACGFFIPKPSIHHDWLWYVERRPEWDGRAAAVRRCDAAHVSPQQGQWRERLQLSRASFTDHASNPFSCIPPLHSLSIAHHSPFA